MRGGAEASGATVSISSGSWSETDSLPPPEGIVDRRIRPSESDPDSDSEIRGPEIRGPEPGDLGSGIRNPNRSLDPIPFLLCGAAVRARLDREGVELASLEVGGTVSPRELRQLAGAVEFEGDDWGAAPDVISGIDER